MTVCIAAICDNGNSIAVAMDRMLSTSFTSGDIAKKGMFIHKSWMAMYAANDLGRVGPTMEYAYSRIQRGKEEENETLSGDRISSWFAEKALCEAFQYELNMESTRRVLAPYGLTRTEFLHRGLSMFGPVGFSDLRREIESVRLDMEFLLIGFAENGEARIFHVCHSQTGPGLTSSSLTLAGFWAIESGAPNAIGSLMLHEHTADTPHPLGVYRVCEAKFLAERAAGVGEKTMVAVFRKDGKIGYVPNSLIQHVRSQWKKISKPRVPKGIDTEIEKHLTWVDRGKEPSSEGGGDQQ
jgi:hypothetical protein